MEDYRNQILSLRFSRNDAEKVKACERIIKEAQKLKNEEMEYLAKSVYMEAIVFNNEPEKMLACFPWLLSVRDKNPEKYYYKELLWYYKWVINHITKFSSISKERIMNILNDMETRYVAAGYGTKTVVNYKRVIYQDLGEPELAEEAYNEWFGISESSDISNCTACVIDQEVEYLLWKGSYQEAIDKAEDLLNKKYSCAEVPEITYSKVLLSYACLGKFEEAVKIYELAVSALNKEKAYLEDYGRILIYLSLTQNYIKAKNAFSKQLPYALNSKCDYFVYQFYLGALIFLKSLLQQNKLEITLPENIELSIPNTNNLFQVKDLYDFINNRMDSIIKNFNRRNGNNFFSNNKDKTLNLLKLSRKVNLNQE
jgi:tetratricopeptide (TPR) repeat protein